MGNTFKKSSKQQQVLKVIPEWYNVLFLDIDGVLNNAQSIVTDLYIIEPELIKLLVDFVEKHSTKDTQTIIVLSSTWRYTNTTRTKCMEKFGPNAKYIVSYTKNLGASRSSEIVTWLEENTDFSAMVKYNLEFPPDSTFVHKYPEEFPEDLTKLVHKLHVKNVCVIDDLDFYNEIKPLEAHNRKNWEEFLDKHYVNINRKVGITEGDLVKMDELWS